MDSKSNNRKKRIPRKIYHFARAINRRPVSIVYRRTELMININVKDRRFSISMGCAHENRLASQRTENKLTPEDNILPSFLVYLMCRKGSFFRYWRRGMTTTNIVLQSQLNLRGIEDGTTVRNSSQ